MHRGTTDVSQFEDLPQEFATASAAPSWTNPDLEDRCTQPVVPEGTYGDLHVPRSGRVAKGGILR